MHFVVVVVVVVIVVVWIVKPLSLYCLWYLHVFPGGGSSGSPPESSEEGDAPEENPSEESESEPEAPEETVSEQESPEEPETVEEAEPEAPEESPAGDGEMMEHMPGENCSTGACDMSSIDVSEDIVQENEKKTHSHSNYEFNQDVQEKRKEKTTWTG